MSNISRVTREKNLSNRKHFRNRPQNKFQKFGFWNQVAKIMSEGQSASSLAPEPLTLPPLTLWMGTHPVELAGECACRDNSHLAQRAVEVTAQWVGWLGWATPYPPTQLASQVTQFSLSQSVGVRLGFTFPNIKACVTPSSVPPHIPRMGHIPGVASDPTVTDTDHI